MKLLIIVNLILIGLMLVLFKFKRIVFKTFNINIYKNGNYMPVPSKKIKTIVGN